MEPRCGRRRASAFQCDFVSLYAIPAPAVRNRAAVDLARCRTATKGRLDRTSWSASGSEDVLDYEQGLEIVGDLRDGLAQLRLVGDLARRRAAKGCRWCTYLPANHRRNTAIATAAGGLTPRVDYDLSVDPDAVQDELVRRLGAPG
jgi:hypothetical protein